MRYKDDIVKAIIKEIDLQKDFLTDERISTIYFGGGTPSLLSIDECELILQKLNKTFVIENTAEITLEANPDDINQEKLEGWRKTGINRLSIGIQSFFEEDLRWMNRAHRQQQSIECLKLATAAFDNISIDLIYGTPLLTDEMWQQNVETAIGFGIPHLSCYALTVEEKTPLHKQILNHAKADVDNDKQARQFLLLMKWLRQKGYEHYEVSNFARPGFRSRHNSSYWKGEKYLGLGPSAHSYNGMVRKWNIANNHQYIRSIEKGEVNSEMEVLTEIQKLNEYIMIALRTVEGMDIKLIEEKWGKDKAVHIQNKVRAYEKNGLVKRNGSFIQLTDEGMLQADGIAANLFF